MGIFFALSIWDLASTKTRKMNRSNMDDFYKLASIFLLSIISACSDSSFKGNNGQENINEPPPPQETVNTVPESVVKGPLPAKEEVIELPDEFVAFDCDETIDVSQLNCSEPVVSCQGMPRANLASPVRAVMNRNLTMVDLRGITFVNATIQQINTFQVCGAETNFSGANFLNLTLEQSNFNGANMPNASFMSANLSMLSLNNANFSGTSFMNADIKSSCGVNSNFTQANFISGLNLFTSNYSNSNFTQATFDSNINFRYSNLNGSDFTEATFGKVNFTCSTFKGANFLNAEFSPDADIKGADFSGATWTNGVVCKEGSIGRCLQ